MIVIRAVIGTSAGKITQFSLNDSHEVQIGKEEKVTFTLLGGMETSRLQFEWKEETFEFDLKQLKLVKPDAENGPFRHISFSLLKEKDQKKGIVSAVISQHVEGMDPSYYQITGSIDQIPPGVPFFEMP